jgi:hypothetical protein
LEVPLLILAYAHDRRRDRIIARFLLVGYRDHLPLFPLDRVGGSAIQVVAKTSGTPECGMDHALDFEFGRDLSTKAVLVLVVVIAVIVVDLTTTADEEPTGGGIAPHRVYHGERNTTTPLHQRTGGPLGRPTPPNEIADLVFGREVI